MRRYRYEIGGVVGDQRASVVGAIVTEAKARDEFGVDALRDIAHAVLYATQEHREEPYHVAVDENGCGHCGVGRQWTVVGPDGVACGTSWDEEEDADHFADQMNDAYWNGKGDTEAEVARVKAAFWAEHKCGEGRQ